MEKIVKTPKFELSKRVYFSSERASNRRNISQRRCLAWTFRLTWAWRVLTPLPSSPKQPPLSPNSSANLRPYIPFLSLSLYVCPYLSRFLILLFSWLFIFYWLLDLYKSVYFCITILILLWNWKFYQVSANQYLVEKVFFFFFFLGLNNPVIRRSHCITQNLYGDSFLEFPKYYCIPSHPKWGE